MTRSVDGAPVVFSNPGSFNFDGSTSQVELPVVPLNDFSIAFWIKTSVNAPNGSQWWRGAGLVDAEVGGRTDDFGVALTGSQISFGVGGAADITHKSVSSVTDGVWHHVAVTRVQSSGAVKIYVDGALETTGTAGTTSLDKPTRMTVGSLQTNNNYFNGLLDDVRIYNNTLSASAIAVLANKGVVPITYTLSVVNGTGDGDYEENTSVNISANTAAAGKEFDVWTGDVSAVANVNASSTTLTMPATTATVTATYKDSPVESYVLTVNSGSGDGSYIANTAVSISAAAPPNGQRFAVWTGDVSGVANVNTSSTTLTMPALATTVTATYEDIPPVSSGLIAHWNLDETSGSMAVDSSNNAYDAFINSNVSLGVAGAPLSASNPGAFAFNGSNSQVDLPVVPMNNFTIAFWMKTTAVAPGGSQWWRGDGLVDAEVSGLTNDFGISQVDSKVAFGMGGSSDKTFKSVSDVNDGTWHHVAVTRLQSTGAIQIFIDGLMETTATASTADLDTPTRMVLGSLQTNNNYYFGDLDEVRFYDNVLSSTEIAELANKDIVLPPTYSLSVLSGSGDGNYEENTVVNISADAAPSGQQFDKWVGDISSIVDVNSATTTISMPSANASVSATYKVLPTQVVTFNPSDDAYLQSGTRYNDAFVRVENNRRISYLKFDIQGLSSAVDSAELTIKVSGDPGNGIVRLHQGSHSNWTENNLSSSNAPSAGTQAASLSGSFNDNQTYTFDVTSAISSNGVVTLIMSLDAGGNDVKFSSKEGIFSPELKVTYK